MRFLRLFFSLFVASTVGCIGYGSAVVGEGPPDEDAREGDVERTLSAMSSAGPLFDCTYELGSWPAKAAGARITLARSGAVLHVDGLQLRVERVDKSGPHSGRVSYLFHGTGDELVSVSGTLTAGRATPSDVSWYSAKNQSAVCHERSSPGLGIFDDAALDALVTATNGRR